MEFIPYGKHKIVDADITAVNRVLTSNYLTSGEEIVKFEKEFSEFVGSKYAVAVSSGTAALHISMLVAGIGEGDRVITSPNTFVASSNAALYVGAIPDFADIEEDSFNINIDSIDEIYDKDVKAIIPVAYGGQPPNMPEIYNYAKSRDIIVIEDACHGPGSKFTYKGCIYNLGGHGFTDLSVFSFHPVKNFTTAEGGMITTNNKSFYEKARRLRNHGITKRKQDFTGMLPDYGMWSYEMQCLGFNYRMNEIQSALGRSQLSRLDSIIKRRNAIIDIYNDAFKDIKYVRTPRCSDFNNKELISWHLYTLQINFDSLNLSKNLFMEFMLDNNIGTQVLYIPVYLQPFYQSALSYRKGKCRIAEKVYYNSISLPLFEMKPKEVDHVIKTVHKILM